MKLFVFLLLTSVAFSQELTLVVYKYEDSMEVWDSGKKIKEYKICRMSGKLGPKRRQGDLQVPEGIYKVILFNPNSKFVLSFKINYPNASDRLLGEKNIGGDIFFHGKCASIGCISFTDEQILEIYPLVKSYQKTNVLIFPCKKEKYKYLYEKSDNQKFWRRLEPVLNYWLKNKKVPNWKTDKEGYYEITS